ncbi:MAG: hypothetical protein V7750_05435 [Sneathiella sp.]
MSGFWLGLIGVFVGSAITLLADFLKHRWQTKNGRELDTRRKDMLLHMLKNRPKDTEWRKLETLASVIGADYPTTTRLLIELGARGNEKQEAVWALLKDKPLP